jgi:ABC-2 type transport system permease protein
VPHGLRGPAGVCAGGAQGRIAGGGPVSAALAGAGALARLAVRRDRVLLAVWAVAMAAVPVGLAVGNVVGYPTQPERDAFVAGANANPSEVALRGPVFEASTAGLAAWTWASSGILIAAVLSVLMVVRHTRVEEDAGRRELVGAAAVGRAAPVAAALLVVAGVNGASAVLAAVGYVAVGLPGPGSVLLALLTAVGGTVFGTVAAVTAQLAAGAGGARGLALGVLGAAFALAAVGELDGSALTWATPFGWARRARAYTGDRWWVLLVFVLVAAVLAALAWALAVRRDLGAGVLPARNGRAGAGWALSGPAGLAWRLHRGTVLGWAVGAALIGLLLGAVMGSIGDQLDTPTFRALTATLGGGDPGEVFFRFVLYVLAQLVAAGAVAAALRMRTEETAGLADVLLAGPVGRARWAGGHLLATAVGSAVVLAALGLGAGLGSGAPVALLGETVAYLPACLLLAGLAVALYGWVPRAAAAVVWTVFALVLVVDVLGEFRLVGPAVLGLSPFVRTLDPLTTGGLLAPLAGLTAIAAALAAAGLAGLGRRDLA